LEVRQVDGSDFIACHALLHEVIGTVRKERRPFLMHAKVPLLNHHTSGVRMEFYRTPENLAEHRKRDPHSHASCNNCSTCAYNWMA
jgi:2-oxoisovalerate dehydrogenase E1 component